MEKCLGRSAVQLFVFFFLVSVFLRPRTNGGIEAKEVSRGLEMIVCFEILLSVVGRREAGISKMQPKFAAKTKTGATTRSKQKHANPTTNFMFRDGDKNTQPTHSQQTLNEKQKQTSKKINQKEFNDQKLK